MEELEKYLVKSGYKIYDNNPLKSQYNKAFGFEIKKDFFAAANEWIKRTEAQGMLFKDAARNARRREQGRIEEVYASER
jgi:uncharacterized protein YfiM (DUF2279 family)